METTTWPETTICALQMFLEALNPEPNSKNRASYGPFDRGTGALRTPCLCSSAGRGMLSRGALKKLFKVCGYSSPLICLFKQSTWCAHELQSSIWQHVCYIIALERLCGIVLVWVVSCKALCLGAGGVHCMNYCE